LEVCDKRFSFWDIKPTMTDSRSTVLHVSPDTTLAKSRARALTSIGCHVVCVPTVIAAMFEISLGRCGILLLCHKLDHTGRFTLAEFFHQNCPKPYIVAVLAHENDHYPPQAHARVVYSKDHSPLVNVMRERLAAA
jgi:hypothetical protein